MKTPREVLFHRHQAAEAKLDQIRREAVAQVLPAPTTPSESLPLRALLTLWRELILPARRTWAGLAAAWILLLVANSQSSDAPRAAAVAQNNAPVELWQKHQEETQLLAELTGLSEPKVVAPALPFTPRPRSEQPHRWKVV
jgi:hypothetical protein